MSAEPWRHGFEILAWGDRVAIGSGPAIRVNHSIEMELPICSTAIAQSASQEIFESTRNLSTALAVQ